MCADREPVDEEQEFVLRFIHTTYFKDGLPLVVHPEAFRPLDGKEPEGISVYRDRFLSSPAQALEAVPEDKRCRYYIARISVHDLRALGLSVRPDPISTVPGHAVIPELNSDAYPRDKLTWKQVQKRLAELAATSIVHRPGA